MGGWRQTRDILGKSGQVTLTFDDSDQTGCKQMMLALLVDPVESSYQALYPAIEKVELQGRSWTVSLVLPELVGA